MDETRVDQLITSAETKASPSGDVSAAPSAAAAVGSTAAVGPAAVVKLLNKEEDNTSDDRPPPHDPSPPPALPPPSGGSQQSAHCTGPRPTTTTGTHVVTPGEPDGCSSIQSTVLITDIDVMEAVKKLKESVHQNEALGGGGGGVGSALHCSPEPPHSSLPPTLRSYNWNTNHFYPDIHNLDPPAIDFLRQTDQPLESVDILRQTDQSQMARRIGGSDLNLKIDIDLDSNDDEDDDDDRPQRTWHKSPLRVRRVRRKDGRPVSAEINYDCATRKLSIHSLTGNSTSPPPSWTGQAQRNGSQSGTGIYLNEKIGEKSVSGKYQQAKTGDLTTRQKECLIRDLRQSANDVQATSLTKYSDSLQEHGRPVVGSKSRGGVSRTSLPVRHKGMTAAERREFVRQRCRSQGWDLVDDEGYARQKIDSSDSQHSIMTSSTSRGARSDAIFVSSAGHQSRSQEDVRYVEPAPAEWSVPGQSELLKDDQPENVCKINVKDLAREFTMKTAQLEVITPRESSTVLSAGKAKEEFRRQAKISSSFENIYDDVDLRPEGDAPIIQGDVAYKKVTSLSNVQQRTQGQAAAPTAQKSGRLAEVEQTGVGTTQKSGKLVEVGQTCNKSSRQFDAKCLIEEEKEKFAEYKKEYQRQQSSSTEEEKENRRGGGEGRGKGGGVGREIGGGEGGGVAKDIPPDEYIYILRKIHKDGDGSRSDSLVVKTTAISEMNKINTGVCERVLCNAQQQKQPQTQQHQPQNRYPQLRQQPVQLQQQCSIPQQHSRDQRKQQDSIQLAEKLIGSEFKAEKIDNQNRMTLSQPEKVKDVGYTDRASVKMSSFVYTPSASEINVLYSKPESTHFPSSSSAVVANKSSEKFASSNTVARSSECQKTTQQQQRQSQELLERRQYENAECASVSYAKGGYTEEKPPRARQPVAEPPVSQWRYNTVYSTDIQERTDRSTTLLEHPPQPHHKTGSILKELSQNKAEAELDPENLRNTQRMARARDDRSSKDDALTAGLQPVEPRQSRSLERDVRRSSGGCDATTVFSVTGYQKKSAASTHGPSSHAPSSHAPSSHTFSDYPWPAVPPPPSYKDLPLSVDPHTHNQPQPTYSQPHSIYPQTQLSYPQPHQQPPHSQPSDYLDALYPGSNYSERKVEVNQTSQSTWDECSNRKAADWTDTNKRRPIIDWPELESAIELDSINRYNHVTPADQWPQYDRDVLQDRGSYLIPASYPSEQYFYVQDNRGFPIYYTSNRGKTEERLATENMLYSRHPKLIRGSGDVGGERVGGVVGISSAYNPEFRSYPKYVDDLCLEESRTIPSVPLNSPTTAAPDPFPNKRAAPDVFLARQAEPDSLPSRHAGNRLSSRSEVVPMRQPIEGRDLPRSRDDGHTPARPRSLPPPESALNLEPPPRPVSRRPNIPDNVLPPPPLIPVPPAPPAVDWTPVTSSCTPEIRRLSSTDVTPIRPPISSKVMSPSDAFKDELKAVLEGVQLRQQQREQQQQQMEQQQQRREQQQLSVTPGSMKRIAENQSTSLKHSADGASLATSASQHSSRSTGNVSKSEETLGYKSRGICSESDRIPKHRQSVSVLSRPDGKQSWRSLVETGVPEKQTSSIELHLAERCHLDGSRMAAIRRPTTDGYDIRALIEPTANTKSDANQQTWDVYMHMSAPSRASEENKNKVKDIPFGVADEPRTKNKNMVQDEEDETPKSVAEIKAKLFGPGERDAIRFLPIQPLSSSPPEKVAFKVVPPSKLFSLTYPPGGAGTAGGERDRVMSSSSSNKGPSSPPPPPPPPTSLPPTLGTHISDNMADKMVADNDRLHEYASFRDSLAPRRSNICDELTELERAYEKLAIDDYNYDSSRRQVTGSGSVQSRAAGVQQQQQLDSKRPDISTPINVKRLSITNVKMLTDMQDQQSGGGAGGAGHAPSLDYAKEWLLDHRAVAPTSYVPRVESATNESARFCFAGESSSSYEADVSNLPRKVVDDMAYRKLQSGRRVGGGSRHDLGDGASSGGRSYTSSPVLSTRGEGRGEESRGVEVKVDRRGVEGREEGRGIRDVRCRSMDASRTVTDICQSSVEIRKTVNLTARQPAADILNKSQPNLKDGTTTFATHLSFVRPTRRTESTTRTSTTTPGQQQSAENSIIVQQSVDTTRHQQCQPADKTRHPQAQSSDKCAADKYHSFIVEDNISADTKGHASTDQDHISADIRGHISSDIKLFPSPPTGAIETIVQSVELFSKSQSAPDLITGAHKASSAQIIRFAEPEDDDDDDSDDDSVDDVDVPVQDGGSGSLGAEVKMRKQQTPRDVKAKHNCRMRGSAAFAQFKRSADSGYMENESDSHSSQTSGAGDRKGRGGSKGRGEEEGREGNEAGKISGDSDSEEDEEESDEEEVEEEDDDDDDDVEGEGGVCVKEGEGEHGGLGQCSMVSSDVRTGILRRSEHRETAEERASRLLRLKQAWLEGKISTAPTTTTSIPTREGKEEHEQASDMSTNEVKLHETSVTDGACETSAKSKDIIKCADNPDTVFDRERKISTSRINLNLSLTLLDPTKAIITAITTTATVPTQTSRTTTSTATNAMEKTPILSSSVQLSMSNVANSSARTTASLMTASTPANTSDKTPESTLVSKSGGASISMSPNKLGASYIPPSSKSSKTDISVSKSDVSVTHFSHAKSDINTSAYRIPSKSENTSASTLTSPGMSRNTSVNKSIDSDEVSEQTKIWNKNEIVSELRRENIRSRSSPLTVGPNTLIGSSSSSLMMDRNEEVMRVSRESQRTRTERVLKIDHGEGERGQAEWKERGEEEQRDSCSENLRYFSISGKPSQQQQQQQRRQQQPPLQQQQQQRQSNMAPLASAESVRPKMSQYFGSDRCVGDLSDGEMTDATDVTLDGLLGANRPFSPASSSNFDFSDMEQSTLTYLSKFTNQSQTTRSSFSRGEGDVPKTGSTNQNLPRNPTQSSVLHEYGSSQHELMVVMKATYPPITTTTAGQWGTNVKPEVLPSHTFSKEKQKEGKRSWDAKKADSYTLIQASCKLDTTSSSYSLPSDSLPPPRILPDTSTAGAASDKDLLIAQARAEMQQYRKKKNQDGGQDSRTQVEVERRRSIKELVESFEDLSSPFMRSRTRPHSMEINLDDRLAAEAAITRQSWGRGEGAMGGDGAVGGAGGGAGRGARDLREEARVQSGAFQRLKLREVSGSDPSIFRCEQKHAL